MIMVHKVVPTSKTNISFMNDPQYEEKHIPATCGGMLGQFCGEEHANARRKVSFECFQFGAEFVLQIAVYSPRHQRKMYRILRVLQPHFCIRLTPQSGLFLSQDLMNLFDPPGRACVANNS